MEIKDQTVYTRFLQSMKNADDGKMDRSFMIWTVLFFAAMGAITWAIRGSDGWDGIEGTQIPGMTWALIWYFLSRDRGVDARKIILWLGLGIAIGGELGYGQYVSWINGKFYVQGASTLPVSAWTGYAWFFICGAAWAGPGGIILAWAFDKKFSIKRWALRITLPVLFGTIGWYLVQWFPRVFFPHYGDISYALDACDHCERTIYTNTQNFVVFMWWLGALLTGVIEKNRILKFLGLLLGGGFGIGFALTASWCLFYPVAPAYIDWWKMWELSAGFWLGGLYAISWIWLMNGVGVADESEESKHRQSESLALKKGYRSVLLFATLAILLIVCVYGGSHRLGVILELYDVDVVGQYDYPFERLALVAVILILITIGMVIATRKGIKRSGKTAFQYLSDLNIVKNDTALIAGLTLLGVITIWPSKINILYVMFMWLAFVAAHRLQKFADKLNG